MNKKMATRLRKFLIITVILLSFFLSRYFIFTHPAYRELDPHHSYSDVKHDYERYANMWWYGLTPYLKHYYEYPPATIPLLLAPLWFDQHGFGKYYQNYRLGILLIDVLLFLVLLKIILKQKTKNKIKITAIGFYLIAPMVAKDFFYEGIDLAFIGALVLGISSLVLQKKNSFKSRLLFWFGFWLSTCIKFMSAPLLIPFFYLTRIKFKKEILAIVLAFILVWGIPLAIFRSSLSVSFVFHLNRQIKYASFPSFIIQTINVFSKSEKQVNLPPDFYYAGPVSDIVTKIFKIIFPLSIFLFLIYSLKFLFKFGKKNKNKLILLIKQLFLSMSVKGVNFDKFTYLIKLSLIFIFILFLTGKIFSQPFHIWYLPLIAIFPFQNSRQQLTFMFLAILLLIIDTTPWVRFNQSMWFITPISDKIITFITRFLPMILLLWLSFKLPEQEEFK